MPNSSTSQYPGDAHYLRYIGTKIIEATPHWRAGQPGFKVRYDNGHESWSPEEAFRAYHSIGAMTFGQAMEAARLGENVCRFSWPESHQIFYRETATDYIARGYGKYESEMLGCGPILYIPTSEDMMATDWKIVGEPPFRKNTVGFGMVLQGSSLKPA